MSTLFERIGGEAAVEAAVDRFYEIVLADDRIRHFFAGVDMKQQMVHMKLFLKFAFGGSPAYPGRAMRAAHARLVQDLGLGDEHFDAVLDDLAKALRGLGAGEDLIAEVIAVAESVRNDVLGRA